MEPQQNATPPPKVSADGPTTAVSEAAAPLPSPPSATAADSPQKAASPSPDEFKAIYAERMRQAMADTALRRMSAAALKAAGGEEATSSATSAAAVAQQNPSGAAAPTPLPVCATAGRGSSLTDDKEAAELRRRELKERILASRQLLAQQQMRQMAQQPQAGDGGVILQNPVGAVPVAPPQAPPAAAAAAPQEAAQQQQAAVDEAARAFFEGLGHADDDDNNFFFADQQQPPPPAGGGGAAAGQNRPPRPWHEGIGEVFFYEYVLHPFLCSFVLPFPTYMTVTAVILIKLAMKLFRRLRVRIVNRPAHERVAVAQQRQQPANRAADGGAEGQAAVAAAQVAPPAPPKSFLFRAAYIVFKSFITFFVSMFPLFTVDGLRRELERDGIIRMEEAPPAPPAAGVPAAQ